MGSETVLRWVGSQNEGLKINNRLTNKRKGGAMEAYCERVTVSKAE